MYKLIFYFKLKHLGQQKRIQPEQFRVSNIPKHDENIEFCHTINLKGMDHLTLFFILIMRYALKINLVYCHV